jgi:hypothetical protein
MSDAALKEAGISRTMVRIAVGNEDPRALLGHMMRAAELAFDSISPNFSKGFMAAAEIDRLYEDVYVDTHRRYVQSRPKMAELML